MNKFKIYKYKCKIKRLNHNNRKNAFKINLNKLEINYLKKELKLIIRGKNE